MTPIAPGSTTILNVNDRPTARYYISVTLRRAGFNVVEAEDGKTALIAAQSLPDLIVLDIRLPDIDGHEVCRRLRAAPATEALCILQTSAEYIGTESRLEGLASGADGYLAQPFEPQELLATVRALLRARLAERAAQEALLAAESARDRAKADQLRAETALRARDEFFGMASHELRNPASALQLQMHAMLKHARAGRLDGAALLHRLEAGERSARHLVELLSTLLDVSRIEDGRIDLRPEEVDFAEVIESVAERMTEEAQRADCTLTVHAPAAVAGTWDKTRLDQIVSNLLGNAFKYAAGAPVDVSIVPWNGNKALLTVHDHGTGIPPAEQELIFERYERASGEARADGFGLGLWIVRNIVTAMGGLITVENAPTGGAVFRVVVPRSAPRMKLLTEIRVAG